MNCFMHALQHYADFKGRAGRKEYWMFFIASIVIGLIAGALDAFLNLGFLSIIVSLGLFIPSLAVAVRRVHDTNRSGWWVVLMLIPLIGLIAFIAFGVMRGTDGPNEYGDAPAAC